MCDGSFNELVTEDISILMSEQLLWQEFGSFSKINNLLLKYACEYCHIIFIKGGSLYTQEF